MSKQKKDIVQQLNKKIEKTKGKIEKKNKKLEIREAKINEKSKKSKILKNIVGYIEAIIYITCIIAVIFANLYGSIYIQMIPMLFVLGIVGKIAYNRPVSTTIFGMVVAVCALYITGVTGIYQNLLLSFCMAIYIALGEICAYIFEKLIKYIKNKKDRFGKKTVFSFCFLVITLTVTLSIHNYTNSNIFEYRNVKKRLENYFVENYKDKNFKITSVKYNFLGEKTFNFDVREIPDTRIYNFVVSKSEKFEIEDGYLKYEKANKEKNANAKLIKYLKDNNLNEKYKDMKLQMKLNEIDNFEFEIIKDVETINEDNVLEFSKKVALVINDLKNFEYFKQLEQIVISLKNTKNTNETLTSYLYIERYLNNDNLNIEKDYIYIQKSLNEEYIN